jgi:hypothetical protein
VQVGAVRGGDGQLTVEGLVGELLVAVRVARRVERLADQCPLDGERRGQAGGGHTDRGADDAGTSGTPAGRSGRTHHTSPS